MTFVTGSPLSFALAQGLPLDPEAVERIAADASEHPLPLGDVLTSVDEHHPQVRSALQRSRRAQAEQLAADGGFDPRVMAQGTGLAGGYYELLRADVELRQPTGLWGAQFYAGYRVGVGLDSERRFPTYYSDETLSGGEIRAGAEIPLWRDGPIDEARARMRRADQGVRAADNGVRGRRFDLRVGGAAAYYRWVAAGHRLRIAERLLALARLRDELLQGRHEAGAVPEFDISDNLRMVYDRSDKLVAVRRAFEQASIELGLYLRDNRGRTVRPDMSRLPPLHDFDPAEAAEEEDVLRTVTACHPRLAEGRAELAAMEVDLDLANNRVAPDVRATVGVARDLGDPERNVTLPGTTVQVGLRMSMPLFLRTARGEAGAMRATVQEKQAQLEWLEDQLLAAVRNAKSALEAAADRVEITARLVEVSEAVAQGERRRFDAGSSTLLAVNLREQAAADAAQRYIDAVALANVALFRWNATSDLACANS